MMLIVVVYDNQWFFNFRSYLIPYKNTLSTIPQLSISQLTISSLGNFFCSTKAITLPSCKKTLSITWLVSLDTSLPHVCVWLALWVYWWQIGAGMNHHLTRWRPVDTLLRPESAIWSLTRSSCHLTILKSVSLTFLLNRCKNYTRSLTNNGAWPINLMVSYNFRPCVFGFNDEQRFRLLNKPSRSEELCLSER